jgi:putative phosphoesterase
MRLVHTETIPLKLPCSMGVISDTHISGKLNQLNPNIVQILRRENAQIILHLGDITDFRIITDLEQIAEVFEVRGNRDFTIKPNIPFATQLNVDGIKIGLTHGHGLLPEYLLGKIIYLTAGFRFNRYRRLLDSLFPEARVRLFGHTHSAFIRWINGVQYFNPGAACAKSPHNPHPSFGILRLENHENIQAKVMLL